MTTPPPPAAAPAYDCPDHGRKPWPCCIRAVPMSPTLPPGAARAAPPDPDFEGLIVSLQAATWAAGVQHTHETDASCAAKAALLDAIGKLREERDAAATLAKSRWDAAIAAGEVAARLRERVEALEGALQEMLASAVPHPVEHPTMTRAWTRARAALRAESPQEKQQQTCAASAPGVPLPTKGDDAGGDATDRYDMSIHSNPDARAWARFFMESYDRNQWAAPDEEMMVGWFANAMMAMHDHLRSPATPTPTTPPRADGKIVGFDASAHPNDDGTVFLEPATHHCPECYREWWGPMGSRCAACSVPLAEGPAPWHAAPAPADPATHAHNCRSVIEGKNACDCPAAPPADEET